MGASSVWEVREVGRLRSNLTCIAGRGLMMILVDSFATVRISGRFFFSENSVVAKRTGVDDLVAVGVLNFCLSPFSIAVQLASSERSLSKNFDF